jgi:hypothetical protein
MQLLKRLMMKAGTARPKQNFALRGKYLEGKFGAIKKWQSFLSHQCVLSRANKLPPVPSVEAFKKYIRENPVAKMYLQGGLDQIPARVTQYLEDED